MPNHPFLVISGTARGADDLDVAPDPSDAARLRALTRREREVLRLTAHGLSNAELAEELTVTVGTIKTHLHRIFCKLGVSHRAHAAAIAHRARDVDLDDPVALRRSPSRREGRSGSNSG